MNGGLVPLALLSVTLALMLACVTRRTAGAGIAAFAVAAMLSCALPVALAPAMVFAGLWLSTIVAAALVYWPAHRWSVAALPLCLVAGSWLGAAAALADGLPTLLPAILPVLLAFPARWLATPRRKTALKVAASWLIAIAALALFVSLVPTPGYEPDHME